MVEWCCVNVDLKALVECMTAGRNIDQPSRHHGYGLRKDESAQSKCTLVQLAGSKLSKALCSLTIHADFQDIQTCKLCSRH